MPVAEPSSRKLRDPRTPTVLLLVVVNESLSFFLSLASRSHYLLRGQFTLELHDPLLYSVFAGHAADVLALQKALFHLAFLEVLVHLRDLIKLDKLDHLVLSFDQNALGLLCLLLLVEVDGGFDRIPPVGPGVAADRTVVGRTVLQEAGLFD